MPGNPRANIMDGSFKKALKVLPWKYKILNLCTIAILIVQMIIISIVNAIFGKPLEKKPKLEKIADGVWQAVGETNMIGNTMTLFELDSGGLLLFNALEPTDDLMEQVAEVGDVEAIALSSPFHDTWYTAWHNKLAERNVDVEVFAPRAAIPLFEGLAPITGSLEDHAHTIGVTMYDASHLLRMRELGHTEAILEVAAIDGRKYLCFNDLIGNAPPESMHFLFRVAGFSGLRAFRNFYLNSLEDPIGAYRFLVHLATKEDFDGLLFAHGSPILEDSHAALLSAATTLL